MNDTRRPRFSSTLRPASLLLTLALALAAVLALGLAVAPVRASAPPTAGATAASLEQQFEDVPDSNTFAQWINALYLDNIIGGYPCGGPGEPCVAPYNRPYYRPGSLVTRAQMSKFVDLGRRNISDATGKSLTLTGTAGAALAISSTGSQAVVAQNDGTATEAIRTICASGSLDCWALFAIAASGSRTAHLDGGQGAYSSSYDDNYAAVEAYAQGGGSYGLDVTGEYYRGAHVTTNDPNFYALYVDAPAAGTFAQFDTSVEVNGDLLVTGSKSGYVVDLMQNAGSEALEPGDVVAIVGGAPAVLGDIPVITIRKASEAYSTGVAGVVDAVVYVPDAATRSAYKAQESARREALARRSATERLAAEGKAPRDAASQIEVPPAAITDRDGNVHVDDKATSAPTGRYVNVVTLGAYKAVKVDASFGAIKPGDLLVSSPNPGYAMKADDAKVRIGSVIGKAVGSLDSGTGTISVMVTLK